MAIKVSDSFTDTPGVDLSAHTPDTDAVGGGWTDTGANEVEIDSNDVKCSKVNASAWIDGGVVDQRSSIDFNAGGADNRMSVEARHDGSSYASRTAYQMNVRPSPNQLLIYKTVGGSSTQLGSIVTFTMGTSTTYKTSCQTNSTTIDGDIDDVNKISRTDSAITTGGYGAFLHALRSSANARFDNYLLEDLVAAAAGNPWYYYAQH